MDRERYRRLFVDEARENLAALQNQLVEFERRQDQDDAGATRAAMDEVFRAAHSLKGMAASMGYDGFTKVSHALEDLADKGRGGARLPPAALDVLLEGAEVLAGMVEQVAAGDETLTDDGLADRIWATAAGIEAAPAGGPAGPALPTEQDGEVLTLHFVDDSAATAVRAYMGLGRVSELDGFVRSVPDKEALKTPGTFAGTLTLLFARGTDLSVHRPALESLDGIAEIALPAPRVGAAAAEPAPVPQGQCLEVTLDDEHSLSAPRAMLLHRMAAAHPGYVRTAPPLDVIRKGGLAGRVRFFFEGAEGIDGLAEALSQEPGVREVEIVAEKAEARVAEGRAPTVADERTVRVRTSLLDGFIDSVGELLLTKSRLTKVAQQSGVPDLLALVDDIERVTRDLHDRVVTARMTPLSFITDRFPPLVRNLARKLDRKVDFSVQGTEIELDRSILDEMATPLIHMLRNAVDHGHEGTAARLAAGKPDVLTLSLRARRDRDFVVVELRDDGGGIDPGAVADRALRRGLISAADLALLSDDEKVELICAPGFTTRDTVSETSGRGVGMDVVKASLDKIGGSLRIESEVGAGTTFTVRLPLTVAIIQVLVVQPTSGPSDDVYAIPIHRVDRAIDFAPGALEQAHGQSHIVVGGALVPLFDLGRELGFDAAADGSGRGKAAAGTAILVSDDKEQLAFRVGAVVGQEEVVVKPLGPPLSTFEYLSGAALLADGRCAYILEPTRLG